MNLETGSLVDDEEPPPPEADVGGGAPPDLPPAPEQPLTRSPKKYPFPAKGGSNMGFRVDTLAQYFALDAKVETPEWSAPHESGPLLARDDDLDTAWTCVPSGELSCALGVKLPRPTPVKGIRLFAASPGYEGDPRPRRLRIHTEEGFLDALLPDDNSHVYAVFAKEITTQNLVLEVVEVWSGRTTKVHIAELEVYGKDGKARGPLDVDPRRSFVKIAPPVWRRGGRDTFDRQEAFIHYLDAEGVPHRLAAGTALRGKAGDRFALIERLQAVASCDAPRGTYFLLDMKTRMVAPLGELGGVGGDAFRAKDGSGIVVGYASKLRTILDGMYAGKGKYIRKRTPVREDKRAEDYITKWGLEPNPMPRAGLPVGKAPGCKAVTAEEVAKLPRPEPKKKKRRKKPKPGDPPPHEPWFACDLGDGARAFMTDRGPCGPSWEMHVIDAHGSPVRSALGDRDGSHLQVRDVGGGTLLVEAAGKTDAVMLMKVTATGIEVLGDSAAIALNPPQKCRSICNAGYVNPHTPTWQ